MKQKLAQKIVLLIATLLSKPALQASSQLSTTDNLALYRKSGIAYSPNGEWLAIGGIAYKPFLKTGVAIRLQNLSEPQDSINLFLPDRFSLDLVNGLDFSYDSHYLAFTTFSGKAATIDLKKIKTSPESIKLSIVEDYQGLNIKFKVNSLIFSPVENRFAYGGLTGYQGFIKILADRQKNTVPLQITMHSEVVSVSFSMNGEKLAYGLRSGEVGVIDRGGHRHVLSEEPDRNKHRKNSPGRVSAVKFMSHNRWLAIGYSSGKMSLIDTQASIIRENELVYVPPDPMKKNQHSYAFAFHEPSKTMAYVDLVHADNSKMDMRVLDISDPTAPEELCREQRRPDIDKIWIYHEGRKQAFTAGEDIQISPDGQRLAFTDNTATMTMLKNSHGEWCDKIQKDDRGFCCVSINTEKLSNNLSLKMMVLGVFLVIILEGIRRILQ